MLRCAAAAQLRVRGAAAARRGLSSLSPLPSAAAAAAAADAARAPSPPPPAQQGAPLSAPPPPAYALDDDQLAFEQLAADFARDRLAPFGGEWDRRGFFPVDTFREAAALGLGGLFVPEHLGGAQLSRLSASVVFEALAKGDVPFSAYLSIHNMVAGALAAHARADAERYAAAAAAAGGGDGGAGGGGGDSGSGRQQTHEQRRAELLRRLCSMESFAAYCLTEPQSGSDAASLSTFARRATCPRTGERGWALRGSKAFISGAGEADCYLVMARVVAEDEDEGEEDQRRGQEPKGAKGGGGRRPPPQKNNSSGITAFLVDRRREGFDPASLSFGAPEKKMGWRMQPTAAVHLDGAFVPDIDVVGPLGGGFGAVALKALDGGRVNIAACSVGGAAAALDSAVRYAGERRQFGARVADFQATRFRLVDAATEVEASRLLVRRAAAALDRAAAAAAAAAAAIEGGGAGGVRGPPTPEEEEASALAAMAKRYATDRCFDAANACLQTFGGYGYLHDYGVERVVRDLRVHSLLEGTNEVMRMVAWNKLHGVFGAAAAATS